MLGVQRRFQLQINGINQFYIILLRSDKFTCS